MQGDRAAHPDFQIVRVRPEGEQIDRHAGNATLFAVEVEVSCPSCGEPVTLWVDGDGGSRQTYVEDCVVCCRPMQVRVLVDEDGDAGVQVTTLDA
jgi:hypothetical protein